MEKNLFLVSTANVEGYDQNDNLLFRGKTMLDSSIETSLSNTDVRSGQGNNLNFVYYHTAEMNITINDAQFSLPFLALNVGSTIQTGADMFVDETVSITEGFGTVTQTTPLALQTEAACGWVTLPDGTIEKVEFVDGFGFNLSGANSNFSGDACVRYYGNKITAKKVTVYADMMPSTIKLVMSAPLASSETTKSIVGELQVIVYRASMTGAFSLSMTPDSVASTPLSVRALAYTPKANKANGCEGDRPIYADLIQNLFEEKWYDNVTLLAIEGGDVVVNKGFTRPLRVFAVRNDGSAPFTAPINDLVISTEDDGVATVSNGIITAVDEGVTVLKVAIANKPSVNASINVEVVSV